MKRYLFAVTLILSCVFFGAKAKDVSAEVVDKIVVVVNSEIITQREVDVLLAPVYAQFRNMYKGEDLIKKLEEVRERILKQLIEDRLILSEAKKQNISVEEKDIDSRIDDVKKRVGSQRDLEKMLIEQNLTMREMRDRFKEKIMIRKLIDQKIGARIIITPIEVKNYYNEHKDDFLQPEEIKLRSILIKPKQEQGGDAGALQLARDILKRLREGCDFESLAREYSVGPGASEGGLMGYVKKGDLMPQIEGIVFNLKEGEITGIIQSSLGYHIFKVDEKKERRVKDLSEVRQDVEEFLYRQKADEKARGWIDSLAKSAYIEFK